jgi:hypothetical protein
MAYGVDLSRNAEAELEQLYLWVVERAPQQGATWFNGLERAVLTLDQHPDRCPVAPESVDPSRPVRVLSYGAEASPVPRLLYGRPQRPHRARGAYKARREATVHCRRIARVAGPLAGIVAWWARRHIRGYAVEKIWIEPTATWAARSRALRWQLRARLDKSRRSGRGVQLAQQRRFLPQPNAAFAAR